MIDHKLNTKTLFVFAAIHAVLLAFFLLFSFFQPTKESDKTIELVSLPSSSGGVIEQAASQPSSSPPTKTQPTKTSPPTPSIPPSRETPARTSIPPQKTPVKPIPKKPTPLPVEKKTPAPQKKAEIKTEKEVVRQTVDKPKPEKKIEPPKKSTPVKVQVSKKVVSFDQPKTPDPKALPAQASASSSPVPAKTASDYKHQLAGDIKGALKNVGEGAANTGSYLELVASTLKANWDKPDVPKGTHLFVRLTILPDGTIIPGSITQESPIGAMNESVRKLLQKSLQVPQPLPPGLGSPNYTATIRFVMD